MFRSSYRLALLAVCAALPLLAAARASASTSVQSLALQKSDVPHNCRLYMGRVVTNAYVETSRHMTAAQLRPYGRITGYGNAYLCSGSKGVQSFTSEAVMFANATGAQKYFQLIATGYLGQVRTLGSYRRIATNGLGDTSAGFSYLAKQLSNSKTIRLYSIEVFRRGRFLATVQAVGPNGTWNAASITSYAHTIDSRMKRAR